MATKRERIAPVADRAISVTELFTIGVGPSSSHTVGPMRAAKDFAERSAARGGVIRVRCELFGSLALTGLGHATDVAILLGLAGETPEAVDPDQIPAKAAAIRGSKAMPLDGGGAIPFDEAADLLFLRGKFLAGHANAMRFTAFYGDGSEEQATYFSIGGGAILREGDAVSSANVALRHPFSSAAELLAIGEATGLSIAEIVTANEEAWRAPEETDGFLSQVRAAMMACIARGLKGGGRVAGRTQRPPPRQDRA